MPSLKTLAAIEYHGLAGVTAGCVEAVQRLLLHKRDLEKAIILTAPNERSHGFLLIDFVGDQFAIKTGFASGYGGEGPRGLSFVLGLLHRHRIEILEIDVDVELLGRLDASALTLSDLKRIETTQPVRPTRFWDYVDERDSLASYDGNPWRRVDPNMPYQLIDERLIDLALKFWEEPDVSLFKGHRRLEGIVRDRIGLSLEEAAKGPTKVFNSAFHGETPLLTWRDITKGEQIGRANLFVGVVSAHRSVRAHREVRSDPHEELSEFLVLNHLYRLEAQAVSANACVELSTESEKT